MVGLLRNTFVSSQVYNSLPLIQDVSNVPEDHAEDLRNLQQLLEKHQVPRGVSIRLIHKHYNTVTGEVVVFQDVPLPNNVGEICKVMRPLSMPRGGSGASNITKEKNLQGIHYYVDSASGSLQAYEYADCKVPNMAAYDAFLTEFCSFISERSLQHKFGLKLESYDSIDEPEYCEYEVNGRRSTIIFPKSLPMLPPADCNVVTEWQTPSENPLKQRATCNNHTSQQHCSHSGPKPGLNLQDGDLGLSGQLLVRDSELYNLVAGVLTAIS